MPIARRAALARAHGLTESGRCARLQPLCSAHAAAPTVPSCCSGRSTAEFVQHYYGTKHRTFVPPPPDNGSGSTRVKRLRRNKQDRVLFDSLQSRDEYACE